MIDDIGRAILCDPGVDDVMRSMDDYSPVHPRYRVKAPELLSPETDAIPRPTQAADIYSLGHAIQEVHWWSYSCHMDANVPLVDTYPQNSLP